MIDVGYAGVIGADRLAGGERALRRASRPTTSTATPTARSPTWPTCRSSCCCRGAGTWDDLPAAHAAAVAFDLGCARPAVPARPPAARRRARAAARLPVAGLPVHAAGRRTRAPTTRSWRCSCSARCSRAGAAGGARRAGRARRADEVRAARAGAAVRHATGRAAPRAPRRSRFAAVVGAARWRPFDRGGLLGAHDRLPGRTATRRSRSGACYDAAGRAAARRAGRGGRCSPSRVAFVPRRRDVAALAALAAAVLIALQLDGRPLVLPLPRLVRCRSRWSRCSRPRERAQHRLDRVRPPRPRRSGSARR